MKVFVVLLAVLGTALAAKLGKAPNGLAALLAEKGGSPLAELGTRIVGGQPAPIDEVPYIVSMQYSGGHYCGGSIITSTKIVTAGHCTFTWFLVLWLQIPASALSFRAGSSNNGSGGQVVQVASYVRHPGFTMSTLVDDITVMHLASALDYSPVVVGIGLPAQGAAVAVGSLSRVAGWGSLSENGPISPTLQAVDVPVVSQDDCNASYGGGISAGMLCAGFAAGGKDACSGDSGGPLTFNGLLIGIVSWGQGCAAPNYPGVYTNVAYYRNWIDAN